MKRLRNHTYMTLLVACFLQCTIIGLAFGQKTSPQAEHVIYSDTVNMSLLIEKSYSQVHISSTPPLILSYKDSICRMIWIHNDLSDPIIIVRYSLDGLGPTQGYGKGFIPTINYILLPNETIPACQMCFVERAPQNQIVRANLRLKDLTYKGESYLNGVVIMGAKYTADSLLSLPCFEVSLDTAVFDPVIIDGESFLPITLKSNRNEPVVVSTNANNYDSSAFSSQPSFPVTIPPRSSITVPLRYHPRSDVNVVKYRHYSNIEFSGIWDDIACTSWSSTFVGLAITPTADSIATQLFPDQTQILAFIGEMKPKVKTFYFVNNFPDTIRIVSISMKDGTSFRINTVTPSNTFPFDLLPGENITVDVEMFNIAKGVHYDELIIVVDKAADALHFELQGLQKEAPASVRNGVIENVELSVYPNPTSGSTTFSLNGAEHGELEISDVLGNLVYRSGISDMLVWNGLTVNGNKLSSGSYIVRVRSTDPAKPFIASKLFLVQ
jgi:hypothetical protein